MTTSVIVAALAASLAGALPLQASAQPYASDSRGTVGIDDSRRNVGIDDPPEGFQPRLSAATGVLCVKQCPNDDLPCDPPSYKIADGRCTTQWH